MFYLKALAGIVATILLLNLIGFIFDIVWAIPFGAMIATVSFFGLGLWGAIKLATIWLDEIEGK